MKYGNSDTFNICSIEGGGIRGVYAARLLSRLGTHAPGFLERIHLFAGTSTGGILALGLADGMWPVQLEQLYVEHAASIFQKRALGGLWGAKYSAAGLRAALEEVFADRELRHLDKLVLIPVYDLDAPETLSLPRGGRPRMFESVKDGRMKVVDAALATCAAPTYFPAHNGFVDGGVVCNNPVACAVVEAIKHGVPPEDLRILSVGTGMSPTWIDGDANDWGLVRWATKLPNIMIGGSAGVHETIVETVFGEHVEQLNATLPRPIALDDVSAIDELIDAANCVDLSATVKWLTTTGWAR